MENLNAEAIKKALEWLEWLGCNSRYSNEAEIELTISLIKELSEENKSVRLEYAGFVAGAKSAFDSITKALIEDNKRLSDTVETLRGVVASKDKIIRGLTEEIEVIKAEHETRPPKLIITRKA